MSKDVLHATEILSFGMILSSYLQSLAMAHTYYYDSNGTVERTFYDDYILLLVGSNGANKSAGFLTVAATGEASTGAAPVHACR